MDPQSNTPPPPCTVVQDDARSRGATRLVVILVGRDARLWPVTLLRVQDFLPAGTDVCLVCLGHNEPELRSVSTAMGWSFLAIAESDPAAALNGAIERHSQAQWVHRIDDDIVIGRRYFELLEETYRLALYANDFQIGFVAPTLNVDPFSHRSFLQVCGLRSIEEFNRRFSSPDGAGRTAAVCRDPAAAEFLWELSTPFDPLVLQFRKRAVNFDVCPHRAGGGALLFRRSLWTEMGGFPVGAPGGADANPVAQFCFDQARMMLVSHRAFAGHVGYPSQTGRMIPWITARGLNVPGMLTTMLRPAAVSDGDGVPMEDPIDRQNERLEAFFRATRTLSLAELREADRLADLIGAIGLAYDDRDLYGDDRRYMNPDEYGLWQIPLQLSRFLINASGLQISSFAEVGTFYGYTFAAIAIYLSRFNSQFRAVTVEPIFDAPVAPWLQGRLPVEFRSGTVDALARESFDLALIDGHHNYGRVRYDFEHLSPRCRYCAFHDVNDRYVEGAPENDGGVPRFWNELKRVHPASIVAEYTDHTTHNRIMGIGLTKI